MMLRDNGCVSVLTEYDRMDGQGLKNGYDSHCSPKGNEVVVFSSDQILPRYIITFVSKEAEEREQES